MVIEETVKSDLKLIPGLSRDIFEKLEKIGINKDVLFDIRLSFEEALTNAMRHGNKLDLSKTISFKIEALPDKIEIEVKDQGRGFDFVNTPIPTEKKNLEKLSGRGVFLMRTLMNDVKYFDGGSRVKMVKLFSNTAKIG